MRRLTRRAALATAGSLLAAVAGCTRTERAGDSRTTTRVTTTQSDPSTPEDPTTATETATAAPTAEAVWTRSIGVTSGPVVAGGTILAGDRDGRLHAMTASGAEQWTYEADAPVHSFRVGPEAIYLVTGRRSGPNLSEAAVHAIERASGDGRWTTPVQTSARTPVPLGAADGVLGVGLRNDYLQGTGEAAFGLDVSEGSERWRVETGDISDGAAGPSTLYAAEYDELSALDPADGSTRWSRAEEFADPPTLLDGVALVGGDEIAAIDPATGETRWTYGRDVDLAGVVGVGGRAYTRGAVVAALTADGTEQWRYEKGGAISAHADGRLFGDRPGKVFALADDGTEQWAVEKPAEHFGFAAATESVVAGSTEDTVHAYDRQNGERAYTFEVTARHVGGVAATADRLIVGDTKGLYALEG